MCATAERTGPHLDNTDAGIMMSHMKARTMIYFEPDQLRALKARAHGAGISVAELVRRLVSEQLERRGPAPPTPPEVYRRIVSLGTSGLADVSERHDHYLGSALRRDHLR